MSKFKSILLSQPVKFLKGGVALKVVSFGLNYILADYLGLNKELTYIFVLIADFLLGFAINRYFIFKKTEDSQTNSQVFKKFVIAGLGFRGLNWLIYIGMLKFFELYILIAQLIATIIVLLLKYSVYKKIFK